MTLEPPRPVAGMQQIPEDAAGAGLEISLVAPAVIAASSATLVQVHIDNGRREGEPNFMLVARRNGNTVVTREVDATATVESVEIIMDEPCVIVFVLESKEGEALCEEAYALTLPSDCAEEICRVYRDSFTETMVALDETSLEDDIVGVEQLAWRNYFRYLVRDIALVVELDVEHRRGATSPNVIIQEKLPYILVYLLENHAYSTGDFLLKHVLSKGHPVTMAGVLLTPDEIDLENLCQRFPRVGMDASRSR